MKKTLKSIYKQGLVEKVSNYDFDHFYYFIDEESEVFGIEKSSISPNEKVLIEAQYDPFDPTMLNPAQLRVFSYLFGKTEVELDIKQLKYYFIRSLTHLDEELQGELIELLKDSFEQKVIIHKKQDVLIVLSESENEIDFSDLLQSIEADFMIQIIGFESELDEVTPTLARHFQFDLKTFRTMSYKDTVILSKAELVRHYLIKRLDPVDKEFLKAYTLKRYKDDQEMLQVITAYFETNFNTSLAAKQCYMHRNTFQNKLDKFTSETHFNLRHYDDAFIIYLAIQL